MVAAARNFFECEECHKRLSLNSLSFCCPDCNGLLFVTHDPAIFQQKKPAEWKQLFAKRKQSYRYPFISGVWDYKEWVLADLCDESIVSLGEGRTPNLEFPQLAKKLDIGNLFVKQCGLSHSGSFKDIGMTVLVSHAQQLRHAKPTGRQLRAVLCASSGDTSAALACYAARANIPAIVLLPVDRITRAQLLQPLSHGTLVLALETDFDGCMKIIRELVQQDSSLYLANSMNPLRMEGQKTIAIESLLQMTQVPDWIAVPSGNLGNLRAQADGMQILQKTGILGQKTPRLLAAQSSQANPFYLSFQNQFQNFQPMTAKRTVASAIQIGNPVSFRRAMRAITETNGAVEQAHEREIFAAAKLADTHGLFSDPHTAVGLACIINARKKGLIQQTESVLLISTANALKFIGFKEQMNENRSENTNGNADQNGNPTPEKQKELQAANFQRLGARLHPVKLAIDSYLKKREQNSSGMS